MSVLISAICVLILFADSFLQQHHQHSRSETYWSLNSVHQAKLPKDSYPLPSAINQFISRGVQFLIRSSYVAAQNPHTKGQFEYRLRLSSSGQIRRGTEYDVNAHSSTISILAALCRLKKKEVYLPPYCKESHKALMLASKWLTRFISPMGETGALGIWHPSKHQVRLGEMGAGVTAFVALINAGYHNINAPFLSDLSRAFTDVFLHDGDGFAYTYTDKGLRHEVTKSSPREAAQAAFGILQIQSVLDSEKLRDAAILALTAAANHTVEEICESWTLRAIAALFRDEDYWSLSDSTERGVLLKLGRNIVRRCHKDIEKYLARDHIRTTDIAQSTEAVLSLLPMLAEKGNSDGFYQSEFHDVYCTCKRALAAVMSMQYRADKGKLDRLLDGSLARAGILHKDSSSAPRHRIALDGVFPLQSTHQGLSLALTYLRVSTHPLQSRILCFYKSPVIDSVGIDNTILSAES